MPSTDHRSRSRSPHRHSHRRSHRERDDPSSSSHRHHHHRRHHERVHKSKRTPSPVLPPRPVILPFKSRELSKHDMTEYRPVLASYLDIQKQLYIDDMTEDEVKGRWKSFMKKWNSYQLAEGWYDPATKEKAIESAERTAQEIALNPRQSPTYSPAHDQKEVEEEDDDEDYGPVLPSSAPGGKRSGPSAPSLSELALRNEEAQENAQASREDVRYERKQDRKEQKSRMDELVPRAEPGTRERQLEKKREAAASNRTFADARGGGDGVVEVAESDLMGSGGGVDDVKRMRQQEERKKNERELRRDEIMRAKAVEREERMAIVREKEDKTMEMLKAIAKERFG